MKKYSSRPLRAIGLVLAFLFATVTGAGPAFAQAAPATQPAAGGKYVSQEGKFKIAFAGQPTVETQKVPTPIGDIQMYTFMEMKGMTDAYMVSYNDYPANLMQTADSKSVLDGAKNGVINQFQAKIVEEKTVSINGNPGVMCKASTSAMSLVYYVYLVKNRLYQIMILKNGTTFPDQKDVDAFHGSFEITT